MKNIELEERKKVNIWLLYTILFAIAAGVSSLPFLLRGSGLICTGDAYNEVFPIFSYICRYIRELLRGNVLLFDFRLGLGENVIASLNYPGLGDMSLVLGAFFPENCLETAYTFIMLLKYYLCGAAFIIYSRRYIKAGELRVAGALMYLSSAYILFWGLHYWSFINPMITLPLILSGVDEVCGKKDFQLSSVMVFALFAQGLTGFYFLYMEVIIVMMYYGFILLFRLYQKERYSVRQILRKTFHVFLNGMAGVGMSGVLLLPGIMGYFSSTRSADNKIFNSLLEMIFYEPEYYWESFGNLLMPNVYHSILTLPVMAAAGGIVFIFSRERLKEIRWLTVLLWGLFWTPLMGSIMNGFSYSSDRWYFGIVFFMTFAGIFAMENQTQMSGAIKRIYYCITGCLILLHLAVNEKGVGLFIRTAVFAFFLAVIPVVWNNRKKREKCLLAFTTITVLANCLFVYGPTVLGGSGYSAAFRERGETYSEIMNVTNALKHEEDGFERWDVYGASMDGALTADYFGTSAYFSVLNRNVSEFYQSLYISPGILSSAFSLRGLDSRQELESFLSVSQYTDFEINVQDETVPVVRRNDYFLPLGFTYDQWMEQDIFEELNPMEKESVLLDAVILNAGPEEMRRHTTERASDSYKELPCKIELLDAEGDLSSFCIRSDSKIRVYFASDGAENMKMDGEIYVRFSDFLLHDKNIEEIRIGNKTIQLRNKEMIYYTGIDEYWINVTEFQRDKRGAYFDIQFSGNERNFSISDIRVYWHEINYAGIEKRNENTLSHLEVNHNAVKGKLNCKKDEILFLSIPYSSGWKARVDGKNAEIYQADIAFMALLLEEGEHDIELYYETPGLKAGICVSICMFVLFLFLKKLQMAQQWKKKEADIRDDTK